ncbi:MAG: hypothetical protein QOG48_2464 [Verrucomicrobiota bacterium]
MKIAWLAPYPISLLQRKLQLRREGRTGHACSWILNLSRALACRRDVDLHLITLTAWVAFDQRVEHEGITFHVLKNGIPFLNRGYPPSFPLDVFTGFWADANHLADEISLVKPDVVHAHGTESAFARGALDSGYPVIVSVQGIITEYQKTNPSLRFRIHSKWEQREVRRGKYFGCRTRFDAAFVEHVNPRARIFRLQEAISPVFFQRDWKTNASDGILFVGSLEQRKGVDFLLEALALVRKQRPNATLTLVGEGTSDYVNKLRQRVREFDLSNAVFFRGRLEASQIAEEHLCARIFVLPTLNDNSPNTLAEAMVSGMPVIASAVGGIPSMIDDGTDGILVPPKDIPILASKIIELLGDSQMCARLGSNARNVARSRHDPDRVADETMATYREVLERESSVLTASGLNT